MHRRIVVMLAVMALSITVAAGCKKKTEETTTAPATTAPTETAPAATAPAPAQPSAAGNGEALFKQHCAACHPDGGNPMNQKKTLKPADMAANNVKTSDDIVKLMRNPGPGMTKFDANTVSDSDAKAIGDYVLSTFK
jgi:cytochrome c6